MTEPVHRSAPHPGDGWLECSCGRRHWGLNGAAGLFLTRFGPDGRAPQEVLLQHRAVWSDQGGTWGIPGGAVADGETPSAGALREANEEAGVDPEDLELVGAVVLDHGPWSYTTLLAVCTPGRVIAPVVTDQESIAMEWTAISELAHRPLLRAFGQQLPVYLAALARGVARRRE